MRRLAALFLCSMLPLLLASTCLSPTPPLDLDFVEPLDRPFTETEGKRIRSLVERRCMVCHGCYDAPCQLLLSSREGLWRGASKVPVYRSSRLRAAPPTRLGIDAQNASEWRDLGFFSVTHREAEEGAMDASLVLAMLALGQAHDFPPDEQIPEEVDLSTERSLSCPTVEEFPDYAASHPKGGMPYGTASLSKSEYLSLGEWAASDAPTRPPAPLPDSLEAEVAKWERLLNQTSLKHRVVARYLYEHWVFAHLYFESHPEGPFFEVVRSKTAPGTPIDVIATRFPYDDPGVSSFYYRIKRVTESIVHKVHITYSLGPKRRARIREIFLAEDWEATRFPSWDQKEASNPFVSFEEIPSRARYQFLLDDAAYFVRTFIRGPVCRGQAATDVIRDRFFVAFLDPDHDISIINPDFLPSVKEDLRLPAESGGNLSLLAAWRDYNDGQTNYRDARAEAYGEWLAGRGTDLGFVWDGDGHNRSALLTVFRNFDNAIVVEGFVGAVPQTTWVMDFPVFERIYYDLVAGFDVFGNVGHQLGVRLYMDNLRMESEDLFLALLPEAIREEKRAGWYEGATDELKYVVVNKLRSQGVRSMIDYQSADPQAELVELLLARNPTVSGPDDPINRCAKPPCIRPEASPLEQAAETALQRLSRAVGAFAAPLPEISLLRVKGADGEMAVYTLIHDKAHSNVAAIFKEEERRQPEFDRVTVVRGILGSYPNFGFDLEVTDVEAFVDALLAQREPSDMTAIADRWGVRRSSPRFWATMDWMQDELIRQNPREAGILDLNRYKNL